MIVSPMPHIEQAAHAVASGVDVSRRLMLRVQARDYVRERHLRNLMPGLCDTRGPLRKLAANWSLDNAATTRAIGQFLGMEIRRQVQLGDARDRQRLDALRVCLYAEARRYYMQRLCEECGL